jgi:hypothetical protein
VLELGEHAEHLQHHPTRWRAGVERLGRRLQHDADPVELLGQPGQLAHLAAETVDAVHEQQVEAPLARESERLLRPGRSRVTPLALSSKAWTTCQSSIAWQ